MLLSMFYAPDVMGSTYGKEDSLSRFVIAKQVILAFVEKRVSPVIYLKDSR